LSQPSKTRARLLSILRLVFALALLAFVGSMLPWKDQLRWVEGKQKLKVAGEIEGKWREDSIRFHADPNADVPAQWPAEAARPAAAAGWTDRKNAM
jgi:hypothetical protein